MSRQFRVAEYVTHAALIALLAAGCVHSRDSDYASSDDVTATESTEVCVWYGARFIVQCTTRDSAIGAPVHYADVVVDGKRLATDYVGPVCRIGMADRSGVVDQSCHLSWCATLSPKLLDIEPDEIGSRSQEEILGLLDDVYAKEKRVAIEIGKDGYQTFRTEFSLEELRGEDGYLIDLGEIVLQPEKAPRGTDTDG